MDTGQRLQQAEDTKQKGNVLFQKKLYKEAECQYNQILQHLPPATNVTGEVKEKRDNLAVAAHLNLALCQLRLGRNTTNIKEHCDEALKINPDSVKAYYRRAQAHQIDQDYQLAIKDYQQVLVLEPGHTAAETRLQLCHTLLQGQEPQLPPNDVSCKTVTAQNSGTDGQPDIAGRLSLTEDHDQTECHDMEVGVECEADCFLRHSKCSKAAHHDKFIALADFTPEHLPPPYQGDKEFYEFVVLGAKSTVWLMVMGISDKRPKIHPVSQKPYPFSSDYYKFLGRVGSGWVNKVKLYGLEDKEDCPCESCQSSGTPAKQWGKIFIETAAHVVCDAQEGLNTKCRFFYDYDQMTVSETPIVRAAVDVKSYIQTDTSTLTFVSHDMDLVKQLKHLVYTYEQQALKIKKKYTNVFENEPKTVDEMLQKLSSLQARFEYSVQLCEQAREKLRAIVDNVTPQWLYDYVTWLKNNGYPDGDHLSGVLRDKLLGGQRYKHILEKDMSGHHHLLCKGVENSNEMMEFLSEFPAVFDIDQAEIAELLSDYHGHCYLLELSNKKLKFFIENYLDKREPITINVPSTEKLEYDPDYPLTVIVSHPHGLSKKISFGEVVGTEAFSDDEVCGLKLQPGKDFILYRYNNVTCPGSSGARVYILGERSLGFNDTAHGGGQRLTSSGQINETVIEMAFLKT